MYGWPTTSVVGSRRYDLKKMSHNLQRHNETGHIHFWPLSTLRRLRFFHDDPIKQIIIDSLQAIRTKHNISLIGYVVMPEHVHILLLPQAKGNPHPIPVSKLLSDFKQRVGYHAKARLRDIWRECGQLWSDPLNDWAHGKFESQQIWAKRGYDRNIFSEQELCEKLEYCHKNPVTRELVESPEDWWWSSYRFYEYGESAPITMDWDGGWPVRW